MGFIAIVKTHTHITMNTSISKQQTMLAYWKCKQHRRWTGELPKKL